jgi:uncharacterized protein YoxC
MSNIHYIVLIVALWAIYLIFIFLFKSEKEYQKKVKELEKTLKGIKEKKETWELEPKVDQKAISDVDYERAKKDMLEKGLKIWERLGTDNK